MCKDRHLFPYTQHKTITICKDLTLFKNWLLEIHNQQQYKRWRTVYLRKTKGTPNHKMKRRWRAPLVTRVTWVKECLTYYNIIRKVCTDFQQRRFNVLYLYSSSPLLLISVNFCPMLTDIIQTNHSQHNLLKSDKTLQQRNIFYYILYY